MKLDPDCFQYVEGFLAGSEADSLLTVLWKELQWSQREITLFGRRVMQPRLVAWYGDPAATYGYSGLRLQPLAWHPGLQALREKLEQFAGNPFNSVLANAYRDGSDSMGWHSDDEPELGLEPLIASLSLGAERAFLVRSRIRSEQGGPRSQRLVPAHGSLLVMRGSSQRLYQHAVPKTRRPVNLRINLTYRLVGLQEPV